MLWGPFCTVKKAQISLEYLSVIGISLLLVFPLTLLFVQQTQHFTDDIKSAHLEKLSRELIAAAEEVFYIGSPTQKKLKIYFPEGIQSITIEPQYIQIDILIDDTVQSVYVDTLLPLNMSGTLETFPGPHNLLVSAEQTTIRFRDLT